MKLLKDYKYILSVSILIVALAIFAVLLQRPQQSLGSVGVGNDYTATSTRNFNGTALTNLTRLECKQAFARVTITGANTGIVRFWDATTTNANLRDASQSSSTLQKFDLPASLVAGVYDFDAQLKYGLIYELVSGNAPTSTVACR